VIWSDAIYDDDASFVIVTDERPRRDEAEA
jgi:hypothetical protein